MGQGLMTKMLLGLIILVGLCTSTPLAAYADTTYGFSCHESSIKGAVPYVVIGTYRSIFRECSGKIVYDMLKARIKSVELSITIASLESNCKWCDDIVKSKRVLDAASYPVIIFKSKNFGNTEDAPWVSGLFGMHGVTKNLQASFELKEQNNNILFLKGMWKINRKDFNIIWNRWLDHGGILVGDYITVDWQVKAHKT